MIITGITFASVMFSVAVLFLIWFGVSLARVQNEQIRSIFELRKMEQRLLVGELEMKHISDNDLMKLSRIRLSRIGMGGIGPHFNPRVDTMVMVQTELAHRRANCTGVVL